MKVLDNSYGIYDIAFVTFKLMRMKLVDNLDDTLHCFEVNRCASLYLGICMTTFRSMSLLCCGFIVYLLYFQEALVVSKYEIYCLFNGAYQSLRNVETNRVFWTVFYQQYQKLVGL